jgi:hypothetical protein
VRVPDLSFDPLASSCAIARVKLKQASSKQNIGFFMFSALLTVRYFLMSA